MSSTLLSIVETLDSKGPLLTVVTEKDPRSVAVAPGLFSTSKPPPLRPSPP